MRFGLSSGSLLMLDLLIVWRGKLFLKPEHQDHKLTISASLKSAVSNLAVSIQAS